MASKKIEWDNTGKRFYETGVRNGVLYIQNNTGGYDKGVAWNGLTSIQEKPSGAEANENYADDINYLNLYSAEKFGATIEAFTYPDEFSKCDGSAEVETGVYIGQQNRSTFALSYRTVLGNDVLGDDYGYKLHIIYGAKAAPSERQYSTINDSPSAITFSWELSTTPVVVPGYKPTSIFILDSTKLDKTKMKKVEDKLYGTDTTDPVLPTPAELIALIKS